MMEALIQKIAEATGIPADLVDRSAQARAQATGTPVEQVLAAWAGEEAPASAPPEEPSAAAATPAEQPATPPAPAQAAVPAAASMSREELVAAAAEAKGMPASLVERSAGARAKKEGVPVEAVLAEWAGVELAAGTAAAAAGETPAQPAPAAPAAVPEAPAATGPVVEVLEPAEPPPAQEAPAAAPAERRKSRYPAILVALLVIVPILAVLYIASVPNGPACGSAGRLAVDPATGQAVGCDGKPYGTGGADEFALGEALFAANCAVCHGAEGGGLVGPALSGGSVLQTFPEGACDLHRKWVTLGSAGWPDPTYGATAKPVTGGMPSFGKTLSDTDIAHVVLYERVAFGGENLDTAKDDCGLIAAAG